MSITTYGFGSGNITTAGFGGYYEVVLDLIPRMVADWLLTRRADPNFRDRDGVDEREIINIILRLKPTIDQLPSRAEELNNLLALTRDKLFIMTRDKGTIVTRDKGTVTIRDRNSVDVRNKPVIMNTRSKDSIPTRERNE